MELEKLTVKKLRELCEKAFSLADAGKDEDIEFDMSDFSLAVRNCYSDKTGYTVSGLSMQYETTLSGGDFRLYKAYGSNYGIEVAGNISDEGFEVTLSKIRFEDGKGLHSQDFRYEVIMSRQIKSGRIRPLLDEIRKGIAAVEPYIKLLEAESENKTGQAG